MNPVFAYQLRAINLSTLQPESPPVGHWATLAQLMRSLITHQEYTNLKLAHRLFQASLVRLLGWWSLHDHHCIQATDTSAVATVLSAPDAPGYLLLHEVKVVIITFMTSGWDERIQYVPGASSAFRTHFWL